jgi:hypothetical protein
MLFLTSIFLNTGTQHAKLMSEDIFTLKKQHNIKVFFIK